MTPKKEPIVAYVLATLVGIGCCIALTMAIWRIADELAKIHGFNIWNIW